ncbi:MAG: isoprenylcysteine carboxylmethyltransferase family protein [Acidobacteriia bacterium]|nr:isoprenylcysteine carboxylmethyltransferase family protein [Terriglobia bacterium]
MNISLSLWAVWYLYWIASARHRVRDTGDSPAKREPWAGRVGYLSMMAVGLAMLFWHPPVPYLNHPLWPSESAWLGAGLAVQAAGLAFAIWARYTLGRNWAGRITVGASQELVIRGPYRLVRHPIYSGLLFGILGTAIVVGQVRGFLGLLLVLVAVMIKLGREESALRGHFGPAYEKYAEQVPALVPGWPR